MVKAENRMRLMLQIHIWAEMCMVNAENGKWLMVNAKNEIWSMAENQHIGIK